MAAYVASSSNQATSSESVEAYSNEEKIEIPQLFDWTQKYEEIPAEGNTELVLIPSLLIELQGKNAHYKMAQLYGEKIVESALKRYALLDTEVLNMQDLLLVLGCISARVTIEDLKDLHRRLAIMKKDSVCEDVILRLMPEKVFKAIRTIAKTKRFAELTNRDLHVLMQVYRPQKSLVEDIKTQSIYRETFKKEKTDEKDAPFKEDLALLEILHHWDQYKCPLLQREACSEYLGRDVARAKLEPGMIVACPFDETGIPHYFRVCVKVRDHGFRFYLLKGVIKTKHNHLISLTRGTDSNSLQSLVNNLGNAAGIIPFSHAKEEILEILVDACKKTTREVTLDLIGYSQGGAISCHLTNTLADIMAHHFDEEQYQPLRRIHKINVMGWCVPATAVEYAKQFSEDANRISQKSETRYIEFSFTYCIVGEDFVSTCGEVFDGAFRCSNNISCSFLKFAPRAKSFPDIHMLPILKVGNKPQLLERYDDDRTVDFLQEKKFELLDCLITRQQLNEKMMLLLEGREKPKQLELLQQIATLSEEELETFWLNGGDSEAWDLAILGWEEDELHHYIANLAMINRTKKALNALKASFLFAPSWVEDLEKLTTNELLRIRDSLFEEIKNRHELILPQREHLCEVMQSTKFMMMRPANRYLVGPLLEWSKESLYTVLSKKTTAGQKAGVGAQVGVVTLIPFGLAYAPVVTMVAGTAFGVSVGIKKLISWFWS